MEIEAESKAFFKALGVRIKTLRKERGWSLRDMIVLHGYHDTQWRKTERGESISIPSLLKLAKLFDLSVSKLLDGVGESYPLPDSKPAKPKRAVKAKRK